MIFYQKCLYLSNLHGLMCRNVLPILYPVWLLIRPVAKSNTSSKALANIIISIWFN